MKEVVIIGTLHSGWTPPDELRELLARQKPDKLLVELSPEELDDERRKRSIRDEMFSAYDWARENEVPVEVFDEENDILKEGVRGDEPAFTEYEQKCKEVLAGYTWKDLNDQDPYQTPALKELHNEMHKHYIDKDKEEQRERNMLDSIRAKLIDGRNAVVTGAGHLPFFEQEIPEAEFPLKDN